MRHLRLRTRTARDGTRHPAAQRAPRRGRSLNSGVVCAACVVAASAALFGFFAPVHISAPGPRAAIETLITSFALVGATVLLVSFWQRRQRSDLLLLAALGTVGLTDFVFSALPAVTGWPLLGFGSVAQVTLDALGAIAIAAVAFVPTRACGGGELRTLALTGVVGAAIIVAAAGVEVLAGPPGRGGAFLDTGLRAAAHQPLLLIETAVSAAVLLVAGVAFLQQRKRTGRPLAGAAFMLAAARLQYLALPAMAPEWVTARDALRLAAYALLVAAALVRYLRTRREMAAAALVVERERIARDLHDGLAQDLAFIALQGQRLESEIGSEHPLTVAARRALAASRGVIVDLSASTAASTDAALRQVANELAARFGAKVDVRILERPDQPAWNDLDPGRREDVVRIAREAIVNAVRHGGADQVAVVVDRTGDRVCLRISDNGHGVAQARLPAIGGHGLQMMRARAAALGGRLEARQKTDAGFEVEVTFAVERGQERRGAPPCDQAIRQHGDGCVRRMAARRRATNLLRGYAR